MLYNLPNGKTIYLTIDEYLNLTDEDIQYLVSIRAGGNFNPFHESALGNTAKEISEDKINSDYIPDDVKEEDYSYGMSHCDDEEYYEEDFDFLDPTDIN
jgi:hypothetical protein